MTVVRIKPTSPALRLRVRTEPIVKLRFLSGLPGPSNSLSIGTVTTGAPGSSALASITGSSPSQTLNLTIPQGPAGGAGVAGPAGEAGMKFLYSTDVANSDPTLGKFKFDNSTFLSATKLYISETDADNNGLSAWFATFDDSTSAVRGYVLLRKEASGAFFLFDVTGTITDNGGWDTFSIVPRSSGGSIANGDTFRLIYLPKGDKGDAGALMPDHMSGLAFSNNATDPNNDIDVTAGKARDDADTEDMVLASALTKRLDAAWAVGNNQGGLDTGTKAVSTWYYLWLIKRTDTGVVDWLFSASATSPTMPANYTKKRRITPGAVRTDASGNILAFTQAGEDVWWAAPVSDITITNTLGTASTPFVMTVPRVLGILGIFHIVAFRTGSAVTVALTPGFVTATQLGGAGGSLATETSGGAAGGQFRIPVSGTGEIRASANQASSGLSGVTLGWSERRGRFL